jgi:hypothetical protein
MKSVSSLPLVWSMVRPGGGVGVAAIEVLPAGVEQLGGEGAHLGEAASRGRVALDHRWFELDQPLLEAGGGDEDVAAGEAAEWLATWRSSCWSRH